MRERQIIFSAASARAILEGRKTQTRRVVNRAMVKGPAEAVCPARDSGWIAWRGILPAAEALATYTKHKYPKGFLSPFGEPGDRFRVYTFRRSYSCQSRITVEVVNVRVERLHDITEADARAEGVEPAMMSSGIATGTPAAPTVTMTRSFLSYLDAYRDEWDHINAKRGYPWASNPWVWVVEFRRL